MIGTANLAGALNTATPSKRDAAANATAPSAMAATIPKQADLNTNFD
jgi:hypothetical protein